MGATPAIGVAVSEGTILVNDAQTPGNTTIFDGSTLQTQRATSQVRLKDGAQVRFDSESRGKLFTDHVDLQQGSAKISAYSAVANGLDVRADGNSSATVSVKGKVVEVAALTGSVHVFNAEGMNVANLLPGRALDLRPQDAGASSPSSLTGCPVKSGSNFLLTDETSNVTAQLRGGKVSAGKRVQVTGSLVPNAAPRCPFR
jgi:ferric-dicitrate binding protein FerR (iron transport regulator)